MCTQNVSELTYQEAFEIMSVAMNEAVRVLMSAAAQCDDLFLEAIEKQMNVEKSCVSSLDAHQTT